MARFGALLFFASFLTAFAHPPTFVGSQTCSLCHKEIAATQQKTAMANTWQTPATPWLSNPFTAQVEGEPSYLIHREDASALSFSVNSRDQPRAQFPIDILLGGARHGLGFLFSVSEIDGSPLARKALVQARFAWSADKNKLLLAPGCSPAPPATVESKLGLVLSPTFESRCLACHGQSAGVRCESCHGPGSEHLQSIARHQPPGGILGRKNLSPPESIAVCAGCHIGLTRFADPSPNDLLIANQAVAIQSSECYLQSGKAFSCVTCHDPHNDAKRPGEKICLGCHSSSAAPHASICPVNSVSNCIGCHMPSADVGALHLVDHLIRVHPEQLTKPPTSSPSQIIPVSEFLREISTDSGASAAAVQARLENGEPFYDVARAVSNGSTAAIGGFLDRKNLSDLNPAYRNAAAHLACGETSAPFEAGGKWVLLQRLARDFRWQAEQLQDRAEKMTDLRAAIETSRQALTIYPRFLRALQFIGLAYVQQGNAKKGAEVLRTATRLYPIDANSEFLYGSAEEILGERTTATGSYRLAISLEPDFLAAYVRLGTLYYSMADYTSAIATFRSGLQIDPLSADLSFGLASALEKSGFSAESKKIMALARKLDQNQR